MTKRADIAVLFLVAFFALTCKKEPSPITPPPPPSHPTIAWTADTIRNPYADSQLQLSSIWGSDTNDVYATGHNGAGGNASLFHFDGKAWTVVKVTQGEGGFIASYVWLMNVDGSGRNDVWVVGSRGDYNGSNIDSSLVIHYDGSSWKEVQMQRCKFAIQSVKVNSPNDVFLGGSYGEVYHYNGSRFIETILDSNVTVILGGDNMRMFSGGYTFYLPPQSRYFCVFSSETDEAWQLIKSASEVNYYQQRTFGVLDYFSLGNGRYFVGGDGIYVVIDSTWQLSYSQDDYPYGRIRGTSADNVFAISALDRILHWDGVDWKLLNLPDGLNGNQQFGGLWVRDNKVFISCWYGFDVNIIYRGTY